MNSNVIKLLISILLLTLSTHGFANEKTDLFSISAMKDDSKKIGIPTESRILALEKKANELIANNDCKSAIAVLEDYQKMTNYYAKMLRQTLEPYYNASYDDKKSMPYDRIGALAVYEREANSFLLKRNIGMILQAECYLKINKKEEAMFKYYDVLDLISIDETDSWERAKKGLLEVINYKK